MPAGELRARVTFDRPQAGEDGAGGLTTGWQLGVVGGTHGVPAQIEPRLGTEEVMASRLSGRQPVTIRIRSSIATRQLTAAWRARDVRRGVVYNIRSIANVDERDKYLDVLAEQGVAD